MNNLKEQYNDVVFERKGVIEQIKELEKDEKVGKYIELKSYNDKLIEQQQKLYIEIKNSEYSSCTHIWIEALWDIDSFGKGHSYNCHGCIKCGLDQRILARNFSSNELFLQSLSLFLPLDEQKLMYDFMKQHAYRSGVDTHILCDLDLGKAIYSKIKERHPDIDDETAMKYFEVALNDIRSIKVSEDRKENRAKRLSLSPKFNKWNGIDVQRY